MAVPAKNTTKVNLKKGEAKDFRHFPDSRKEKDKSNTQTPVKRTSGATHQLRGSGPFEKGRVLNSFDRS
jgi:hypothetical protein